MRRIVATLTLGLGLGSAAAAHAAAGTVVVGEDLCQINRGQDQLPMKPGADINEGDVIKCIGKTKAKAFFGDVLVLFGPLSETQVAAASPATLTLVKGSLRAMSAPGSNARLVLRTPKAAVTASGADVFLRYNAASEFTEVLTVEGRAHAENTGAGAAGSVDLNPLENTLLSPESPPSQPSPVAPEEVRTFTRDTELSATPPAKGDVFNGLEATMARIDDAYTETRRSFAQPSLPMGGPFRSLDSRRQAFVTPQLDQPGLEAAPGGASISLDYDFPAPQLRADQ